jgi:hypothetical protein
LDTRLRLGSSAPQDGRINSAETEPLFFVVYYWVSIIAREMSSGTAIQFAMLGSIPALAATGFQVT